MGVSVGVAVGVDVPVALGIALGVAIGVAVPVVVGVGVGVGRSQVKVMVSILHPSPGTPLKSLPMRHRNTIVWPKIDSTARSTLVVMKPPEFPVNA